MQVFFMKKEIMITVTYFIVCLSYYVHIMLSKTAISHFLTSAPGLSLIHYTSIVFSGTSFPAVFTDDSPRSAFLFFIKNATAVIIIEIKIPKNTNSIGPKI